MLTCHAGFGLPHQTRVHACGLDDRLSSFVSTRFVFEALNLRVYFLKVPSDSFFLPVYSFWCMDEFGWVNTFVVDARKEGGHE